MPTTNARHPDPLAKFAGLITCGYCPWAAEMKSDAAEEVRGFLRKIALQHHEEQHQGLPMNEIIFEDAP